MKQIIILFLVFMTGSLVGQEVMVADTFPPAAGNDSVYLRRLKPGLLPYNPEKPVSFRMEVGSTFGLSSGGGQMFGVYVSPHVSYRLSDKWRLNVSARIQNSNFINFYNPYLPHYPEYTRTFDSNITQTLIYAESEYLVNPRLMISTKVFKEVSVFDQPQINPRALDLNSEGVSVGFNYRVSENFQFGAEVGYSKGRNPYNPLFPGSFGYPGRSPYGISPLSPFD
ncbi:MAG: hypothetical protein IH598_17830 [Bacteroidales bacterium]|nr:hypothetical protein [Bacteroidales bacterium]